VRGNSMRRHWVLAAEMLTALAQEPQDRRRPNWQATNFAAKVVSHNNNLRLERDNPYTSTFLVDLTKALLILCRSAHGLTLLNLK
jgi:hypothetical protein